MTAHEPADWVKKQQEERAAEAARADIALTMLVSVQGQIEVACEAIPFKITPDELRAMRDVTHSERYRRLKTEHGDELTATATATARKIIDAAAEVEIAAIEKARTRLSENRDPDPAKTAAALASVKAKNIEKMVQLENRPSGEKVERDLAANLISLVRGKFIEPVEGVFIEADDVGR